MDNLSSDVWQVTVSPGAKNTPLVCASLSVCGGKPVEGRQRITTSLVMTEKKLEPPLSLGKQQTPKCAGVTVTLMAHNWTIHCEGFSFRSCVHSSCNLRIFKSKMAGCDHSHQTDVFHTHSVALSP